MKRFRPVFGLLVGFVIACSAPPKDPSPKTSPTLGVLKNPPDETVQITDEKPAPPRAPRRGQLEAPPTPAGDYTFLRVPVYGAFDSLETVVLVPGGRRGDELLLFMEFDGHEGALNDEPHGVDLTGLPTEPAVALLKTGLTRPAMSVYVQAGQLCDPRIAGLLNEKIVAVLHVRVALDEATTQELQCIGNLHGMGLFLSFSGFLDDARAAWIVFPELLGGLSLSRSHVTEKGLEYFRGSRDLGVLDLSGTYVSDGVVELVGSLPGVVDLNLSDTLITERGFRPHPRLDQLRHLDVSHTQLARDAVENIYQLPDLVSINLSDLPWVDLEDEFFNPPKDAQRKVMQPRWDRITDASLWQWTDLSGFVKGLARPDLVRSLTTPMDSDFDFTVLKNLEHLHLFSSGGDEDDFSDLAIVFLLESNSLRSLNDSMGRTFEGRPASPSFHLFQAQKLEYLDIFFVGADEVTITRLFKLLHMKKNVALSLGLDDCPPVRTGQLKYLSQQLRSLRLGICIDEENLAELTRFPVLRSLEEAHLRVSNSRHLRQLRTVERLSIEVPELTSEILRELSLLPALKSLTITFKHFDPDTPMTFSFPKLKSLKLEGPGLGGLDVVGVFPGLEELDVNYGGEITGISRLANLRRLVLHGTQDKNRLGSLLGLKKLERIVISLSGVGAILPELKTLPRLRELGILGVPTPAELTGLQDLRQLIRIDFISLTFNFEESWLDKSRLPILQNLKYLRAFGFTSLRQENLSELEKLFPGVIIVEEND